MSVKNPASVQIPSSEITKVAHICLARLQATTTATTTTNTDEDKGKFLREE